MNMNDLIKDMEQQVEKATLSMEAFKQTALYTNPGDMRYLGRVEGEIRATNLWLEKLKNL